MKDLAEPLYISEDLLTRVGTGGLLSAGGLARRPAESYLVDSETLLAAFEPPTAPTLTTSCESVSLEATDRYTTVVMLTTRRLLIINGHTTGNQVQYVPLRDIESVNEETKRRALRSSTAVKLSTTETTVTVHPPRSADAGQLATLIRKLSVEQATSRLQQLCHAITELHRTPTVSAQGLSTLLDIEVDTVKTRRRQHSEFGEFEGVVDDALDQANRVRKRLRARAAVRTDDGCRYQRGLAPVPALQERIDGWVAAQTLSTEPNSSTKAEASEQQPTSASADSSTANRSDENPTRAELIEELQRLDDGTNLVPKGTCVGERGHYSLSTYLSEFGTWDEALAAGGIDKEARLISELRRVSDKVGRTPKTTEMNEIGQVSATMYNRFFGSWSEAVAHLEATDASDSKSSLTDRQQEIAEFLEDLIYELGATPSPQDLTAEALYTVEEIREAFGSWSEALATVDVSGRDVLRSDLENISAVVDGPVTRHNIKTYGRYDLEQYLETFGDLETAIAPLVGVEYRCTPSSGPVSATDSSELDDPLLEPIQSANKDGDTVAPTAIRWPTGQNLEMVLDEYDDWNAALTAAGVEPHPLITQLKSLANSLDQVPKPTDHLESIDFHRDEYVQAFGSWPEALAAAGLTDQSTGPDAQPLLLGELDNDTSHSISSTEHSGDSKQVPPDHTETDHQKPTSPTDSRTAAPSESSVTSGPVSLDPELSSTEHSMLAYLEYIDQQTPGRLTQSDLPLKGPYVDHSYRKAFDSWEAAVERTSSVHERLLARDVIDIARLLGRNPTQYDLEQYGLFALEKYEAAYPEIGERGVIDVDTDVKLKKRYARPDRADLITALKTTIAETDEPVTPVSVAAQSDIPIAAFLQEFGTWDAALNAAGSEPDPVLAEIRGLAEALGRVPTASDFHEFSDRGRHEIFEGYNSWTDALAAAGLDIVRSLQSTLRDINQEVDDIPTSTDIGEKTAYHSALYADVYGTWSTGRAAISYKEAPESEGHGLYIPAAGDPTVTAPTELTDLNNTGASAAELNAGSSETDETTATSGDDDVAPTELPNSESEGTRQEAMIDQITTIDTDDVVYPHGNTISNSQPFNRAEIIAEFGSWDEALAAAGIDREQRLIDEIYRVADELGHPPSTTEMNQQGRISATTCTNHLGQWSELKARLFDEGERSTGSSVRWPSSKDERASRAKLVNELPTVEDIEDSTRIHDPFIIKVVQQWEISTSKIKDRFSIEDLDGNRTYIRIWETHEKPTDWEVGSWYALTEALGEHSESAGPSLSSSSDLEITKLGSSMPTDEELAQIKSGEFPSTARPLQDVTRRVTPQNTDTNTEGADPTKSSEIATSGDESNATVKDTDSNESEPDDPLVKDLMDEMDDLI